MADEEAVSYVPDETNQSETITNEKGEAVGYAEKGTIRKNTTIPPELAREADAKGINYSEALREALIAKIGSSEKDYNEAQRFREQDLAKARAREFISAAKREGRAIRSMRRRRGRTPKYARQQQYVQATNQYAPQQNIPFTQQAVVQRQWQNNNPIGMLNNQNPYTLATMQRGEVNPMLVGNFNPFQRGSPNVPQRVLSQGLSSANVFASQRSVAPNPLSMGVKSKSNVFGIGGKKGGRNFLSLGGKKGKNIFR